MHTVGFEPTTLTRVDLESTALDHSAMCACWRCQYQIAKVIIL